jgi:hypothetical protein
MTIAVPKKIARLKNAASMTTAEKYIASMMPQYGSNSVKRWTRRGHFALEREDLLAEVPVALMEVWNMYAAKKSVREIQLIGTRAIHNHVGNVFHHVRSRGAKDAVFISSDVMEGAGPERFGYGGRVNSHIVDHAMIEKYGKVEPQLERLIAREEIAAIASFDLYGDNLMVPPLHGAVVEKTFRDVQKALRDDDGYLLMRAAEQLTYYKNGRVIMTNGSGPESPDVEVKKAEVKKAEVKKAEVKKAEVKKAEVLAVKKASGLPTPEETKARAASFTKGQKVTYRGGGRLADLKTGAALVVIGSVMSKGRAYVRASCGAGGERKVTVSGELLSKL